MNYYLFHGKITKYLKQISSTNTHRVVKKDEISLFVVEFKEFVIQITLVKQNGR